MSPTVSQTWSPDETRPTAPSGNSPHSKFPDATFEGLSRQDVAALSIRQISQMSSDEMVHVIRSVRLPHLREGVNERLPYLDSETLRRLVFLTRRYCRNLED